MKQILILNPEKATKEEIKKYSVRKAVRAVLFDKDGKIGLVHAKRNKHYKIPGGGMEKGESQKEALKRECKEEIGVEIEVIGEIGSIIEYRKMWKLTQISYCYLARVKGKKGSPHYMEDEIEDGFEPVWLPYKKAIKCISSNHAESFEGKYYIVPRDSAFLKESKSIIGIGN